MKTIVYISPDSFFDVDFPILEQLNKEHEIYWIPIIPEENSRYSKNEIAVFAKKNNLRYHLFVRKGRRRNVKNFSMTFNLICKVRSLKPDIIYSEYFNDPYMAFFSTVLLSRNKVIYAIHDVVSHTNFDSTISRIGEKYLRYYFKYFHLFSESQKHTFDKQHPNKISFYAPLAMKDFGKAKVTKPSKNTTKFLFFGNILEYKGLDLLIQAFEALIAENTDRVSLTIAGRGIYWGKCKSFIKHSEYYNLNIDYIPNSSIPDLFKSHHFLVLPYLDVTQSGPQMIAFNYNLPTIASDHVGFKEYIDHNKTGFLFQNSRINLLKEQLRDCAHMSQSEYDKMLNNLKIKSYNDYQLMSIIKKYDKMFDSVLNIK